MANEPRPNLIKAVEIRAAEAQFSHPWNQNSCIIGSRMGLMTGLQRTGVSLGRIPAGKESFVYHMHHLEEEWLYIIAGRGIAEIDEQEFEIGAGDFMGFPTPSVAHHLRNPFEEDLVYLMGGESRELEVADFPRLGKRMIRRKNTIDIYEAADRKEFGPLKG